MQTEVDVITIQEVILDAKRAKDKLLSFTDDQLDQVITDIAVCFRDQLSYLAQREVDETRMGNAVDKTHKLNLVLTHVVNDLLGKKTYGYSQQENAHVAEYLSPVGLIFAVIPATNPVPNSLFKALLSIKTRNALIVSYPRAGVSIGSYTIELIQTVLKKHGISPNLISHVPLPSSKEQIQAFMSHQDVDLILATGGSALVKAAYSSGNPAYGVGPGNVPVIISQTADVRQAAIDIIKGKSYDNGIVCGSESNLLVNQQVVNDFTTTLESNGAAVLTEEESIHAKACLFDPATNRLKRELIGVSGQYLADLLEIKREHKILVLVIPTILENDNYLLKEKMAPLLAMVTVKNDDEAIALAKYLLNSEGAGHTAAIHSQDLKKIDLWAQEMPAGRLLVNTSATHGMLGETTCLPVSFMLGSGTYGGNITTDAITWRHLLNIKHLAFNSDRDT